MTLMETSTWKDQLVMLESYMYIVTLYNNLYTDKRRYNSKCTNRVHKEDEIPNSIKYVRRKRK